MEPIIEELVTKEELMSLKTGKVDPVFLGYYFNCLECQEDGYLHNQDQAMCPKCGTPFHLDDLGEDGKLEPHWKEGGKDNFGQLKHILDPDSCMGEEVIVNEEPEDIITDAT